MLTFPNGFLRKFDNTYSWNTSLLDFLVLTFTGTEVVTSILVLLLGGDGGRCGISLFSDGEIDGVWVET